jgi:hypothetical protein
MFPRAVEALYTLLVERGVITPFKHGETLVAIVTALAIATATFTNQPTSLILLSSNLIRL